MKKFVLSVASALIVAGASGPVAAQTATGNGGAGGAGGSAAGGMATGGSSTNTNSTTGGTSSAAGGAANIGSATSNFQGSEVSVNYITPAGAAGVNGLAPGVDPSNNHFVTDIRTSGTTKIKNTPDVNLGGPASGACNGLSGGVGVGIPGLAVAGNISTVDKGCEARETARVAAMLGRMDVANAILENMEVVVAALKAKTEREARDADQAAVAQVQTQRANAANVALAQAIREKELEAARAQQQAARDREAESMRAQQQAGIDALARQATMAKVYDTLTFTGKLTQGEEQTPQQVMAADLLVKQQAAEKERAVPIAPVEASVPSPAAYKSDAPVRVSAVEAVPVLAQTPAKSDEPVARTPVLALAVSTAQSKGPESVASTKTPPAAQREASDRKKKSTGGDEKGDPQAAMRFALGLE